MATRRVSEGPSLARRVAISGAFATKVSTIGRYTRLCCKNRGYRPNGSKIRKKQSQIAKVALSG